jgi:hypothetical protein
LTRVSGTSLGGGYKDREKDFHTMIFG